MSSTNPIPAASTNDKKNSQDANSNNTAVTAVNAASAPAARPSIFTPEVIQRYNQFQVQRKAKEEEAKQQSEQKDNAEDAKKAENAKKRAADEEELRTLNVKGILQQSSDKFPKLIKYIADNEKPESLEIEMSVTRVNQNVGFKVIYCGLLEKIIFDAISLPDLDLLKELKTLQKEHNINVDPNCIATFLFDNDRCTLNFSPLLYSFMNHPYIEYMTPSYERTWSEEEVLAIVEIIEQLIMMGATIDDQTCPAFSHTNITFLHVLTSKACLYSPLKTLFLDIVRNSKALLLNLSIRNENNDQILDAIISKIVDIEKTNYLTKGYQDFTQKKYEKILHNCIEMISELIRTTKFNYLHDSNILRAALLDNIVTCMFYLYRDVNHLDRCLKTRLFEPILEDMGKQALEQLNALPYLKYRDIELELTRYITEKYSNYNYRNNTEYYTGYYNYIYQGYPAKKFDFSFRDEWVVKDLIVSRAMRRLKEQYSLGYTFEDYQQYLPIQHFGDKANKSKSNKQKEQSTDTLWDIVLGYCDDNLSIFHEACQFRLHVRFSNAENSEQLYSFINATQIVPFSFDDVTKMIESCPNFERNRTEAFAKDDTNKFSFYFWTPTAAEQRSILMGTTASTDPKLTHVSSNSTSMTTSSASASTQAVSGRMESLDTQVNLLLTNAASIAIGITDFGQAKEYGEETNQRAHVQPVCFYQFSEVQGGILEHCQIIVQPSLLRGNKNTVIRYLKDGQPTPACIYLPSDNPIYLELDWKFRRFTQTWQQASHAGFSSASPDKEVFIPEINTFEELAEELAYKKLFDRINPPSKTSLLFSTAAGFATRLFSWNSPAPTQASSQTAYQTATSAATAAAAPANPSTGGMQITWFSQCCRPKKK